MSAAHTPGPWAVFHDHPDPATAISLGLIRPANSKGYDEHDDVASVYVCELPERAANARLIAAAPELLEALQLAVRQNSLDMALTGDELRRCESAIAKATGSAE